MVGYSKAIFDKSIKYYECSDIFHVKYKNCYKEWLRTICLTIISSSRYFAIIYTLQVLKKKEPMNYKYVKNLLKQYLRSCSFAAAFAFLFQSASCIGRNTFGYISYYYTGFGVGVIQGLSFILNSPQRKSIELTIIVALGIEGILKLLTHSEKKNKLTNLKWTTIFMICNALLMLNIHKQQLKKKQSSIQWILMPSVENKTKIKLKCLHEGDCLHEICRGVIKFCSLGLLLGISRNLLYNFNIWKTPKKFFNLETFKLITFAATYCGIYKTVNCLLYRFSGRLTSLNVFLTGLLAGTAYWINPTKSLITSEIALILNEIGNYLKENKIIPSQIYGEQLTFMIVNGFLMHLAIFYPNQVPKLYVMLIDTCSNGVASDLLKTFEKIFKGQVFMLK